MNDYTLAEEYEWYYTQQEIQYYSTVFSISLGGEGSAVQYSAVQLETKPRSEPWSVPRGTVQ